MYNSKTILTVVPARGGSKEIPLKNIQLVGGKTLIEHAADVIKKSTIIDRAILSSDSKLIQNIATSNGLDAPFKRPAHLSGSTVGDLEVLNHALIEVEKIDKINYDYILMLQPTSPFRRASDLSQAVELLDRNPTQQVWSVSEVSRQYHPFKQFYLEQNSLLYADIRGTDIVARQQLGKSYIRNGIVYAYSRNHILNYDKINMQPLIIDRFSVNIDSWRDLEKANLNWNEFELGNQA